VHIETCATMFWERVVGETSWETFVYYMGNSNMGTVFNSSSSSGNRCDYIHDQTNIYMQEEYGNSGAMRYAMRTKIRIVSQGTCGKLFS